MTSEQERKVEEYGLKLKEILVDFTGSVTYNFSEKVRDVKYDIRNMGIAKGKTGCTNTV